jgi:hypothetical protein
MRTSKSRKLLKSAFFAVALGGALVSAGCAGLQQSSGGGGNLPGGGNIPAVAVATVSVCDSANTNCQTTAATYSLSTARDLSVAVNWANVPAGNHSQEIRLLMPNGNVYQRFENSFLVPASDTAGTASVSHFIPVSGTFIAQRQITGGWKLEVSLDGKVTTVSDLQFNP